MAAKFLDYSGLTYFWGKIKGYISNYVKITTSGGVSTITIGSTSVTPPNPSSTTPVANGTASTGSEQSYSRGDHCHPHDSTKQDTIQDLQAIRAGASAGASAYQKPSGGIPSTDLASGVQTSLDKADTAYQKPSGGVPSTDLASGVQTSLGKADTAYQKPSGGVPSADLASGVQTSLGKADSAYQKPAGGIPSTDLASGVQSSLDKADAALPASEKGATNGVCPLSGGKIDEQYLPSYVDDVIEAYSRSGQTELSETWLAEESATGTVISPEGGKIYVLMNSSTHYNEGSQFRWGGTAYVKLNDGGVSSISNSEIDTIFTT